MRYRRALLNAPIAVSALLLAIPAAAQAGGMAVQSQVRSAPRGLPPLTSALAKALSRNVTDKVIVVFRDQLRGLPDTPANSARRGAAARASQVGVLADLKATHAVGVKSISLVNAVAATVSAGEAKRLAADPAVAEVTPDRPIPLAPSAPLVKPAKAAAGLKPLPNACPTKNAVQLDPEAIEAIHAATQSGKGPSAQALGYTGAGVKVAYIADGADPNNPDFIRANGKHVFVDNQDFSGTGTSAPTGGGEAFLDASSIAAQGRHVYNVQGYGAGLSVPCRIRILGVAPGASLVGLNVFGSSNVAFNSVFLEAINYAVSTDHVNVINESFGSNVFPDTASLDLTKEADDAAVKAGVTVTVSSGDAGVTNTIGSPATDPNVISVGASTTYRAYAQTGIGGIAARGVKGWIDNNISGLSSAGFSQTGRTVDVVAPGDLNWALCTPKPKLFGSCTNFASKPASVELAGGTSESAPLTAGVAALVIQAYQQAHHGHRPTPAVIKRIIVSTAQDISAPAEQQGAGLVDAYAAVLAARSFPGPTQAKAGHAVLESSTQFNAVDPGSTDERFAETLTNDGSGSVTVNLSSRELGPALIVRTHTLTFTRDTNYEGVTVKFRVAPGQARLNVAVALKGAVNISLIAPNGDLAEYNLPQGVGNYGDAQVANPAAGSWSALVTAQPVGSPATLSASFIAETSTWRTFGTLSKSSVTLAPGASSSFTFTPTTSPAPGDNAGSIVLTSTASEPAFTKVTTIPVTLRTLLPVDSSLEPTLTGGNGRGANTGQAFYYQMKVGPGLPELNAVISSFDSSNTLLAELVDPAGVAESTANNTLFETNSVGRSEFVPTSGAGLHVMKPAAGRWTLIIDFYNSVSGTAALQPFSINTDDLAPTATENGLPTSAGTQLPAGTAAQASVTVTNTSRVPEAYFVDARLCGRIRGVVPPGRRCRTSTVKLAPQTTGSLSLPNLDGLVPTYLVPTLSSKLSATVTAPAANFFDLSYPFGDPDVISSTGKKSALSYSGPISAGDWTVTPFLKGPDGANGAKPVNAKVAVTARIVPIDRTVSSPTGDLWFDSTDPTAGLAPYVVQPHQTVTIPVTIIPNGRVGSVAHGTLYLADVWFNPDLTTYNGLSGAFPTASNITAFPYTYTIGP
jgi:hypothetical protein